METLKELDQHRYEAASNANTAEAVLTREVIFISATALALIGALVASNHTFDSKQSETLLVVSVAGLTLAVVLAVIQLILEFNFWQMILGKATKLAQVVVDLPGEENDATRRLIKEHSARDLEDSTERTCLYLSVAGFLFGVLCLGVAIVLEVLSS